jgi:hypothetical protein
MKRTIVFVLAIVAAAAATTADAASQQSPRSRPLHVTKDCSAYQGQVGQFCTIKSSNFPAIEPGMNVVYLAPLPASLVLDSDLVLSNGHDGAAVGHVVLDLKAKHGVVTFSAGTGRFRHFRADVVVTQDRNDANLWHWDGSYRIVRSGDDD